MSRSNEPVATLRFIASPLATGEAEMYPNEVSGTSHMKFYFVYILRSLNHDFIYAGFTSDLTKRFLEHNTKQELSTKHYAPFELIFYEAYRNIKDAKRREEYFKTTKGKTTLKLMLKEYLKYNRSVPAHLL